MLVSRDVIFNETLQRKSSEVNEEEEDEYVFAVNGNEQREVHDKEQIGEQEVQEIKPEIQVFQDLNAQRQHDDGRQLRDRTTIRPPVRYVVDFAEYNPPNTFQEAMNASEAENWVEAIKEELDAHEQNNTSTLVPREKDRKPIDSKWVFKVKQNVSGDVYRYKARLCARGFQQKEGLDYTETFSPVVRYDSLRVLLAVVAEKDLELVQFDVRTAFLHGELKEEIYMEVPEGLNIVEGRKHDVVCKLNKSLYGLKQAPRCWNERFHKFLQKFSLRETEADKCIFGGSVNSSEVFFALFVDDGLIAAKSSQVLESVIKSFEKEFEITIGKGEIFVGVQIKRDWANKTLFLHQEAYTKKILSRFKMSE